MNIQHVATNTTTVDNMCHDGYYKSDSATEQDVTVTPEENKSLLSNNKHKEAEYAVSENIHIV